MKYSNLRCWLPLVLPLFFWIIACCLVFAVALSCRTDLDGLPSPQREWNNKRAMKLLKSANIPKTHNKFTLDSNTQMFVFSYSALVYLKKSNLKPSEIIFFLVRQFFFEGVAAIWTRFIHGTWRAERICWRELHQTTVFLTADGNEELFFPLLNLSSSATWQHAKTGVSCGVREICYAVKQFNVLLLFHNITCVSVSSFNTIRTASTVLVATNIQRLRCLIGHVYSFAVVSISKERDDSICLIMKWKDCSVENLLVKMKQCISQESHPLLILNNRSVLTRFMVLLLLRGTEFSF